MKQIEENIFMTTHTLLLSPTSCGAQPAKWTQADKLLNELNKSREEIKAGKGKILKSLKDLR